MLGYNAVGMDAVAMSGANATAPGSSVSADLALAYVVKSAIASDLAAAYVVRSAVAADLSAQYAVRTQVISDLGVQFAIGAAVSADLPFSYSVDALVLSSVSSGLNMAYTVFGAVSSDLAFAFILEEAVEYVRAPLGTAYSHGPAAYPDSLRRLGVAGSAVSFDAARRAARVDGDELDDDVLIAAIGYTEAAEHATGRAFVQQTWRANFGAFSAEMILPKPPLIHVVLVAFYDEDGVRRFLDPQDYFVDGDAEPAVLSPAPGRTWPATLNRAAAVEVQYQCGYGSSEASVPKPVKQYVLARVQQQFSPVSTAKDANFDRLLDSYWVYS